MSSRGKVRISEEYLRSRVAELRVKGHTGHSVAQAERMEFCDVQTLDLGFTGILIIEKLWAFTSLTTLHLNNNCIQKLEGLSRLTNLTCLNLSFNKIMEIEGLESLTKLQELNLSSNNISVLKNIDFLDNLVFFNIADNHLKGLNQVMYLRKLKHLISLNFSGNPLSEEDDYKLFVIAFFPKLKYLDYRYVKSDIKKQASDKFRIELQQLNQEDEEREKKAERLKTQQAEEKVHADAFVELLNGPFFFEHMIKDDPLANELQSVPEVATQQKLFRQKTTELCVQLFERGLVGLEQRQAEVNSFNTGHSVAKAETRQKEAQLLQVFEKYFKEIKKESSSTSQTLKTSPNDELKKLHNNLLALEFKLIGQIETMIKKLDVEITELIGTFFQTAQDIFSQCRDLENTFHQKVQEIVAATIENIANDEDMEELSDDVKIVFMDKETVMGALTAAHNNHLLAIRDREIHVMTRAKTWKSKLIKKLQEEELHRNRVALADFTTYIDHCEEELHRLFNR